MKGVDNMKKLKLSISRFHYDILKDYMSRYQDAQLEIEKLLKEEDQLGDSKASIVKALRRRQIRKSIDELRLCQRMIVECWWIDSTNMFKDLKEDEAE